MEKTSINLKLPFDLFIEDTDVVVRHQDLEEINLIKRNKNFIGVMVLVPTYQGNDVIWSPLLAPIRTIDDQFLINNIIIPVIGGESLRIPNRASYAFLWKGTHVLNPYFSFPKEVEFSSLFQDPEDKLFKLNHPNIPSILSWDVNGEFKDFTPKEQRMQPVRTTLMEDRARRDQQARASGFKDAADLARAYWEK